MDRHIALVALRDTLKIAHLLLLELGDDYDDMHLDLVEMLDAVERDVEQGTVDDRS